ncbi:PLP-dependent transferase [Xylaria arbuscula]|nr:PLP-dependent transferase [Xylaria arbuscula]
MGGLETTLERLLARRESHGRLRRLNIPRSDLVDFSSNDYLSLSQDQVLRNALIAHLTNSDKKHSSSSSSRRAIGSGGSRLLDGNSTFAENLEQKIADLHGSEAALLFTSAYDANVGLLSCVPGSEDVILYDNLIHASIHDGMRLSRATRKIHFKHDSIIRSTRQLNIQKDGDNDIATIDTGSLEFVLRQLVDADRQIECGASNVFICVEALYSMDGDVADLEYISDVVKRLLPYGNGYIIVDEAHSVGILGDSGGGLVCQLGLQDRIWARVVGFGKAFGCAGGAVLCSSIARLYLVNYARTLIYTTAMSFPSLASINAAYDYIVTGKAHERREQLKVLIQYCHIKLKGLHQSSRPTAAALRVPGDLPSSPIIPVFTSHPKSLAQYCQESGFMIRPIVAPTVPLGQERVRICLHASNTIPQIDGLCGAIEAWLDTLGTKPTMRVEENGQTDVIAKEEVQDRRLKATEAKL